MLNRYLSFLEKMPDLHVAGVSPIYMTEPQDFKAQPWFANQVIKVKVDSGYWKPPEFLDSLLEMESRLGRRRSDNPQLRYGPRSIDADLLLFGSLKSDLPHCVLPHPRMLKRAFVLVPLADIEPDIQINSAGVATWLKKLDYRVAGNKIYQKG